MKNKILVSAMMGMLVSVTANAAGSDSRFYVRLDGGLLINTGESGKASTTTETDATSGVTIITAREKVKYKPSFGGAFGMNLSPRFSLELAAMKSASTQGGSVDVGAPVSQTLVIATESSLLTIMLGGQYRFIDTAFISPFVSAYAGYGINNNTATISGATGGFTSLNGSAKQNGSGLAYAVGLGADIHLGHRFSLVPMVNFHSSTITKLKVSNSTTGVFTDGDQDTVKAYQVLIASLGLKISF